MKLWGMEIDAKNIPWKRIPWYVWLINAIGALLICTGIMVSLIKFGYVRFEYKKVQYENTTVGRSAPDDIRKDPSAQPQD